MSSTYVECKKSGSLRGEVLLQLPLGWLSFGVRKLSRYSVLRGASCLLSCARGCVCGRIFSVSCFWTARVAWEVWPYAPLCETNSDFLLRHSVLCAVRRSYTLHLTGQSNPRCPRDCRVRRPLPCLHVPNTADTTTLSMVTAHAPENVLEDFLAALAWRHLSS